MIYSDIHLSVKSWYVIFSDFHKVASAGLCSRVSYTLSVKSWYVIFSDFHKVASAGLCSRVSYTECQELVCDLQ